MRNPRYTKTLLAHATRPPRLTAERWCRCGAKHAGPCPVKTHMPDADHPIAYFRVVR